MIQIAMLIIGIIALVTGKVKLSKKKVVSGWPARLLGGITLIPIPLAMAILFGWGIVLATQGKTAVEIDAFIQSYVIGVELGVVFGIGLLVVFLGYLWGQDPNQAAEAQLVDDYSRPPPPRPSSNNPYEPPASH